MTDLQNTYAQMHKWGDTFVEFEYELERYNEKDDDYQYFMLKVIGAVEPYVPAKLSGLPENCYPSEGGCGEIVGVFLDGASFDLTEKEVQKVEGMLYEEWEEQDIAAREDAAVSRYEDRMIEP